MDIEVSEVVDFLSAHAPFSELPRRERVELAREMGIRYFRRGSVILEHGASNDQLHLIRSGAVDLTDADGILIDRNTTGDTFGSLTIMREAPSHYRAAAIEDTLVLTLPGARFRRLFEEHQLVADHFTPRQRGRLRRATEQVAETDSPILRLTAEDLIGRDPITASPAVSIREAAKVMTEHRVSALLLTEGDRLAGIVTDRDLRSRVVLTGADVDAPIASVMTADPVTVTPDTRAFELLMQMTGRKVHHLPVVLDGHPVGLVSAGDLMRLETSNPVYVVGDIAKAADVDAVAAVVARAPKLANQLLAQGAEADDVTHVLTAIADAATTRIVQLAEAELGAAPHPWVWVALGSQARRELALGSDQDHAIIVDDAATDLSWFTQLAERVVDGLERCGYHRCPGEAMATKWCLTVEQWTKQFQHWILEPQSQAILHAQIFFDMRPVTGDASLLTKLQGTVVPTAARSSRFLGHLAAMAVRREPPLGFFRGFVVERSGEHEDQLDIKAGGLHGIIEAVRAQSLAAGVEETGTLARIDALRAAGKLSADSASELADAFRFVSWLRVRNHVDHALRGETPDNFIDPDRLTSTERRNLREAFGVIRQVQQGLAHQFQTHVFN